MQTLNGLLQIRKTGAEKALSSGAAQNPGKSWSEKQQG